MEKLPSQPQTLIEEFPFYELDQCRVKFQDFISRISKTDWKHHLIQSIARYPLNYLKLEEITIEKFQEYYQKVHQRYKKITLERKNWIQYQLRIFIWSIAVSPAVFEKPIAEYTLKEVRKLSEPLFKIDQDFCQFQFRVLFQHQPSIEWSEEEDSMLSHICQTFVGDLIWMTVALDLYVKSEKRYLRNVQECRERWQNHLNDTILKGNWTDQEDYIIMETTNKYGKRWALVSRKLGLKRTEHMIKNRYIGIIKRLARKKSMKRSEEQAICKEIQDQLFKKINGIETTKKLSKYLQKKQALQNESYDKKKQEIVKFNIEFEGNVSMIENDIRKNECSNGSMNCESSDGVSEFLCLSDQQGDKQIFTYPMFLDNEDIYIPQHIYEEKSADVGKNKRKK